MENNVINLNEYKTWLRLSEKSASTTQKYVHIVKEFLEFLAGEEITKEMMIAYKEKLIERHAPAGVNVKLAAVNSFLKFSGKEDCRVKSLRIQRQMFIHEEREMSQQEYKRLLKAARGSNMYLIIQVLAATGIRISELKYITVESLKNGKTVIDCKSKFRTILIPQELCEVLIKYAKEAGILSGSIFVTRNGNPLDRSNLWRKMKALCAQAKVLPEKVFPHNLRHLFARTFYALEKDIVRLADLLGHSSIQTTRIYTIESGTNHRKGLERVRLALSGF